MNSTNKVPFQAEQHLLQQELQAKDWCLEYEMLEKVAIASRCSFCIELAVELMSFHSNSAVCQLSACTTSSKCKLPYLN